MEDKLESTDSWPELQIRDWGACAVLNVLIIIVPVASWRTHIKSFLTKGKEKEKERAFASFLLIWMFACDYVWTSIETILIWCIKLGLLVVIVF